MRATTPKHESEARPRSARGEIVARLLAGAWRTPPPPPGLSARELADVAELVLGSGAAGLAWCKIRHSDLQSRRVAHELRQAYRLHSLQSALHERTLSEVIPLLRARGVEPVVVKGWAIARHYPEPGMRPYGDIDLCVPTGQYADAKAALVARPELDAATDLHVGFGKFYDRQDDDILARTRLVKLGDLDVRVLRAEDHLRFLCTHLLRHGAIRPLWLCDVAALVETRAADFDWDGCLGGPRRRADWVACTIALAHELLGAEIDGTPVARRARSLPKWLAPTVLREWGVRFQIPAPFEFYLRRPSGHLRSLLHELPKHWPNPIEATMTLSGPFNGLPRLPFQIGHVLSRTAALVANLPKIVRPVKS